MMNVTGVGPDPMDHGRFPVDPWRLVETGYNPDDLGLTETLFAVGNGYLGMRGNPEEGRRPTSTGHSSTASTRPGRSGTPRTRSASRAPARPSSTSPTPRS